MEFSNNQSTDHQPGEQTEEAGIPIEMVTCGIRSDAMSAGYLYTGISSGR